MKHHKLLWERMDVVTVGAQSIREVSRRISGCEHCTPMVVVSVEGVLDDLLAKPNGVAIYILGESLECPVCRAPLLEATLVGLKESEADFDSSLKYFEAALPGTDTMLIDEDRLAEAQSLLAGCEHCDSEAEISFDYLLDAITGCDPSQVEYLMCRPATCPQCLHAVTEKSLVIPR